MTRDEYRAKCIEAQAIAAFERYNDSPWCGAEDEKYWIWTMTAAFDALHDIARVVSPEATKEMNKEFYRDYARRAPNEMIFNILKVGDLTNPPETKL